MTGNSITIDDLKTLERELRQACGEILDLRITAERGDISPHQAADRANLILAELKRTTI